MAIFRGIGGAGDSTTDATITAVTEQAVNAVNSATAAASSAGAASSSAAAAAASASAANISATNAANSEASIASDAAAAAASAAAAAASEATATTKAAEAQTSANEAYGFLLTAVASADSAASSGVTATTQATNAAASAATASTQATNAATSAANAATSETNAATSATNAAASEASALIYKNSAAANAINAGNFAGAADDSAVAAATSESNAATSETNAASSASSASTSAATATTQATNAASSATSASSSASAAATSATNAATSETNASNSASSAATSALNAATSYSDADASAVAAATSASQASASATTSIISSSNAAASAIDAATSETNAATSATNAANSATSAATAANNAATSANNASYSASAAATSESNAATSATNAANSATSAATSATNAQTAADAALTALDSFDDRYLGQKTSDPTLDNDGNALVSGALYFNTTDGVMKVYDGTNWLAAYASLSGALLVANNLSDLNNAASARTNLGLAASATTDTTNASNISSGTLSADRLATSGVTAGTYGSGSAIPTVTVDAKGRVTGVTTTAVNIPTLPTTETVSSTYTLSSRTNGSWYTIASLNRTVETDVTAEFVMYAQGTMPFYVRFIASSDSTVGDIDIISASGSSGAMTDLRLVITGGSPSYAYVQAKSNGTADTPKFYMISPPDSTTSTTWTPVNWTLDSTAYTTEIKKTFYFGAGVEPVNNVNIATYVPAATTTTYGGIKLASATAQTVAPNAVTTAASRTYAVQLNSSGQGVVNVPWVDNNTTYSAASTTNLGLIKLEDDTVQTVAANTVTTAASRTYGVQVNSSGQAVVNVPWTDTTSGVAASTVNTTVSSANSNFKIPFANTTASTTGYYDYLQDDTATFTYNPSTNTLVAGTFSGSGASLSSLNASNLSSGTVPDARLSGTYSGITLQTNGGNTHYTTPNSGSSSTNDRTVFGLAQYKSDLASLTGAIVFIAPTTASSIMHRLRIESYTHNSKSALCIVQGYRTTGAWSSTGKITLGTDNISVRFGVDPSGKNCVIIGDVTSTWSYPMVAITHAMFSHTGVTDAYCKDWTVTATGSLAGYTNITSTLVETAIQTSIAGTAANASQATKLTTPRAINGTNFDGTAAITTANWGTARTINGVSVNGSTNYTIEPYVEDDQTSSGIRYLTFVDDSTAGYKRLNESSNLYYYPDSGQLGAGALSSSTAVTAGTFVTAPVFLGSASDTATAPAYAWVGDTNTGVWHPAADQIGFTTGGTNRLTLTTTAVSSTLTVDAPTFNATSTTNGGFQGIDADTVSSPSFTWTADLNTGMYRYGTDIVGFAAGGNDEFRVYTSYTLSPGSSRAPIFYDSDNTAYYINPTSTSVFNGLTVSTLKVNTIQNTSGVEVYTAKAWVNFNGTGTVAIRAAGNVTSVTDNGTGDYTVNFTNAMPDTDYALQGTCLLNNSTSGRGFVSSPSISSGFVPTTVSARIASVAAGVGNQDFAFINVTIFR